MSITKVTSIKPKQNIHNKINNAFQGASLRRLEQSILKEVLLAVCNSEFVAGVATLTEEECEVLGIAPVEARRFGADISMAIRTAFSVKFAHLDGRSEAANIILSIDSAALEKAFSIYASGSYRRRDLREKFGSDLEILIPDNTVMRHAKYQVTIEPTYTETNLIKIKNYNVYRNENNWLTLSITASIKHFIDIINNRLMEINNGQDQRSDD